MNTCDHIDRYDDGQASGQKNNNSSYTGKWTQNPISITLHTQVNEPKIQSVTKNHFTTDISIHQLTKQIQTHGTTKGYITVRITAMGK